MHSSLFLGCFSDNSHIAVTFGILGTLSHLCILTSEIDSSVGSLLIGAFATWAGLAISFTELLGVDYVVATAKSSLAFLSFLASLGASTVVYRLFFHSLRHFPGPWGAKISRFYNVSIIKRSDFKYHLELEKLHAEYGDFVRTGLSLSCTFFKGSILNLLA
jgi:hypothetical protein